MNHRTIKQISAQELDQWLNNESKQPCLIDVREEQEIKIAPFPFPIIHLPLSNFAIWSDNLSNKIPVETPVVVICHSGIRSMNFGIWLVEQGFDYQVWNLDGGIDSWSVNIDNSVPRY